MSSGHGFDEVMMADKTGRNLELTSRRLADWLSTHNDAGETAEFRTLRSPAGYGASNEVYLFDILWANGEASKSEELVLRITPERAQIFPRYALDRDLRLQQFLYNCTNVPVPAPRWMEPNPDLLGTTFYAIWRAPGRVPPDMPSYHSDGWFVDQTPDRQRRMWRAGIEAIAKVHEVRPEQLGANFFHDGRERPGLESQLPYYPMLYDWACTRNPSFAVERAFAPLAQNTSAGENVRLSWGDARLGNSIYDHNWPCDPARFGNGGLR